MKREKIAGLLAFFLVSVAFVGFVAAENGPSAEAETLSSDCLSNQTQGISKTEEIDGGLRFQGTMQTPNPCYNVTVSEVQKNSSTYTVNLVGESQEGMCVQCVGSVNYEVTFKAEEPGQIKVLHDGEEVETLEFDPDQKQGNVLEAFVSWLKSLF